MASFGRRGTYPLTSTLWQDLSSQYLSRQDLSRQLESLVFELIPELSKEYCHVVGGQVVGLKLEYRLLEVSLTERDSAIAELRSQLRRTSRTAQAAAVSHTAHAHDLHSHHHQVCTASFLDLLH